MGITESGRLACQESGRREFLASNGPPIQGKIGEISRQGRECSKAAPVRMTWLFTMPNHAPTTSPLVLPAAVIRSLPPAVHCI